MGWMNCDGAVIVCSRCSELEQYLNGSEEEE